MLLASPVRKLVVCKFGIGKFASCEWLLPIDLMQAQAKAANDGSTFARHAAGSGQDVAVGGCWPRSVCLQQQQLVACRGGLILLVGVSFT